MNKTELIAAMVETSGLTRTVKRLSPPSPVRWRLP